MSVTFLDCGAISLLAKLLLSDWPPDRWQDRRLVVGVSGGADSIALLLALHELCVPGQLVVAHLNHGWRGRESDADQTFVVELCQSLDRPCITSLLQSRDSAQPSHNDFSDCDQVAMLAKSDASLRSLNESARADGKPSELENAALATGSEESARRARYLFFQETAYQVGASYVVTAHTANDRVETLLHNMFRGGGLAGAASLVMLRPFAEDLVLARPLLRKHRREIEDFLKSRGQAFREDSSNSDTRYRRNFLRQQVLPLVTEHYPAAMESLLKFSELSEELLLDLEDLGAQWLAGLAGQLATSGIRSKARLERWPAEHWFTAPLPAFASTPWSVVHTALRRVWQERGWPLADMSRAHWQALRELSQLGSGVVNLPAKLRAEADDGILAIGLPQKFH